MPAESATAPTRMCSIAVRSAAPPSVSAELGKSGGEPVSESAGRCLKQEVASPLQRHGKVIQPLAGFERRQQAFDDEVREHVCEGGELASQGIGHAEHLTERDAGSRAVGGQGEQGGAAHQEALSLGLDEPEGTCAAQRWAG